MGTRRLGRGGLAVSATGSGRMGTSGAYGTRDDSESLATIRGALDLGVNFPDSMVKR